MIKTFFISAISVACAISVSYPQKQQFTVILDSSLNNVGKSGSRKLDVTYLNKDLSISDNNFNNDRIKGEMPNAFTARRRVNFDHYRMPVGKLSGKYSSPMPGTEPLDIQENLMELKLMSQKNIQDSIKKK